ncbi:RNA-binding protein NOB1 [Iris pallida]|uniref:RNA-binding protein NOB1 n=1 Tax=Iris pallida TaxID=29817 RepID=A0AAX6I6R5_IRIPA|nr:RNA-binding protein NOB1 [Iris pallida]KAJ6848966.1 RNA-binding protein NOB1 [Iris pallida]
MNVSHVLMTIFFYCGDKRVPLKPPVRKAIVMFCGKRNPNNNHYSRFKHWDSC